MSGGDVVGLHLPPHLVESWGVSTLAVEGVESGTLGCLVSPALTEAALELLHRDYEAFECFLVLCEKDSCVSHFSDSARFSSSEDLVHHEFELWLLVLRKLLHVLTSSDLYMLKRGHWQA